MDFPLKQKIWSCQDFEKFCCFYWSTIWDSNKNNKL